jgi:hypothetical protein
LWFVWFIWFLWLVRFNQIGETNQTNQSYQPVLAFHAPQSPVLADFFSIRLERLGGIIEMGQQVAKGATH